MKYYLDILDLLSVLVVLHLDNLLKLEYEKKWNNIFDLQSYIQSYIDFKTTTWHFWNFWKQALPQGARVKRYLKLFALGSYHHIQGLL